MRVDHVDFMLFDETPEPLQLLYEVQIVETGQRIFANRARAQLFGFGSQRSAILQAGELDAALAALVTLPQ